jgi:endonuclease YncB( thermonuclease family)
MARDEVARLLKSAKVINLHNPKRDKYFRIVADVEFDGESLSVFLLNRGLAVSYDGGTKKDVDWCNVTH